MLLDSWPTDLPHANMQPFTLEAVSLMTQWNLTVSDDTDRAVRTYLARAGIGEDDLSQFVDEAVRRRVFELTVDRIKQRNQPLDQQTIMDAVDEAVTATRANRP